MKDDNVIETSSPLGYTVVCSEKQWNNHIVSGHSMMAKNKEAIIETIQNPIAIYSGDEKPKRHIYFGLSTNATYGKKFYTKVIVSEPSEYTGTRDIITAFPRKSIGGNIDKGGLLYDKSKP